MIRGRQFIRAAVAGRELYHPALASLGELLYSAKKSVRRDRAAMIERGGIMKNLLAVIGDGNAGPVLEAALMVARRFNSHIVGLHSLTTEYAVVFGGEMGFSISSEVDRTLEREGHERRDQARRLFRDFMTTNGVPVGAVAPGHNGPSASWREEDG